MNLFEEFSRCTRILSIEWRDSGSENEPYNRSSSRLVDENGWMRLAVVSGETGVTADERERE